MGFGLALSGGGARGAAHVGVLMALEESGIRPTAIAGTSAGSIIAGLYAAGLSPAQMAAVVEGLAKNGGRLLDVDLCGIVRMVIQLVSGQPVTLQGLVKGKKLKRLLCRLTAGRMLSDAALPTVIPAVDIVSGMTVAYTNTGEGAPVEDVMWADDIRLCDLMMASSAVPGVFRPQPIGRHLFVDGGVSHNLPVNLLIAAGHKNVIAVDVGEPYESPKNDNIMEIVTHSFAIMSRTLQNCTSVGERVLLRPDLPPESGLLTFSWMTACMEAGYTYTKQVLKGEKSMYVLKATDGKRAV